MRKTIYWLLVIFLFLLPWQTRFVYEPRFLNGGFWEYGSSSWYATEILLWIIIILSAIDLFRQKELWQRVKTGQGNKVYLFISLLVIGYLVVEIFHSLNLDISFNFVFRLIGAACLFIVLMRTARPFPTLPLLKGEGATGSAPLSKKEGIEGRSRSPFLLALWAGGVVQGILALWQFFTQAVTHFPWSGIAPHLPQDLGAFVIEIGGSKGASSQAERWLRAYGAFGSPNILGGFLAIVFLFGLLLYLKSKPGWWRIVIMVGQLMVTAGLVLSFSRAAWLAAVVGAIVLIIGLWGHKNEWYVLARPIASSILIAVVLFIALKPLFLVRTESLGRLEHMSLTSRVEQYHDFKKIITTHPLLGVGPGAYTYALYLENKKLPVWQYQPIHNIYLLILAELGIVGFIGVVLLCCCAVIAAWRYGRLFLPISVSLLILGLFDHWLWSMYVGMMIVSCTLPLIISDLDKLRVDSV